MVHEGIKNLAAGANPIVLRKGMKKASRQAQWRRSAGYEQQGDRARSRSQELPQYLPATKSVGEMVADAMEKVSNDGVITIEESKTMQTELDLVDGMQF